MNCIIPIILALIVSNLTPTNSNDAGIWSFGYIFQDEIYARIVSFVGEFVYYTVIMQNPCLFALSMFIIIQRFGLILLRFNNSLKNLNLDIIYVKYNEIAKDYIAIEEKLELLKDTLSGSLFVILLSSFFNLYTSASTGLQFKIPPQSLVELTCTTFTGVVIIFSLTVCSSRIPEYILEIKKTIGSIIDKHQFSNLYEQKGMTVLKRIEKKKTIFLSAGDIFEFKRSFLFSAFGTAFTYGLILVNLK
ncbi:uncharacterized protein NPIL_242691 [Nephila pilipes]|uniref:Gustatory receptor n=1 Tax=Nephila pilipes TaxID=299642 RepID=A0A8X6U6X6_NEPPI|nr:uncharacterized protein NPIL_242691 [Nephila pilipes]